MEIVLGMLENIVGKGENDTIKKDIIKRPKS